MPASRAAVCAALLTVIGLAVTGCGDSVQSGDVRGGTPFTSPSPGRANASPHQETP
jgi:hypothetical protein